MYSINKAFSELGRKPISAGVPAGNAVQDESAEYDRLAHEISKLESLGEPGKPRPVVNWAEVIRDSNVILDKQSKDLRVASWLCAALVEQGGYRGLATGLTIIHDLLQTYGEKLYPESLRARQNAVDWLERRLAKRVEAIDPDPEEDTLNEALRLTLAIEPLAHVKIEKENSFKSLSHYLNLKKKQFSTVQTSMEDAASPSEPNTLATATEASGISEITPITTAATLNSTVIQTDNDAKKALTTCRESIFEIAAYYLDKNPADPQPYRMLRQINWMDVRQLPPDDKIPGPTAKIKKTCQQLLEAKDYKTLISEVEQIFRRHIFWLDAHWLTCQGLTRLGHTDARRAVIDELRLLIRRFPGIQSLRFHNKEDFADPRTQAWIRDEVLTTDRATNPLPEAAPITPDNGDPVLIVLEEAKRYGLSGQFRQGLALLQSSKLGAPSQRERSMRELAQARYCYDMGYLELALPLLERLDEQVERFSLEAWEPELALEVVKLLLMCHDKPIIESGKSSPETLARVTRLRTRLCQLDASAAMDFIKTRK